MILRALLALIACLLALLPPGTLASIPRTAFVPPPVALFGVEFSNEQDCGPLTLHLDGLHDRAGPCGGVLVRQNPWSSFDPEGLYSWKEFGDDAKGYGEAAGEGLKQGVTNVVTAPYRLGNHIAEQGIGAYDLAKETGSSNGEALTLAVGTGLTRGTGALAVIESLKGQQIVGDSSTGLSTQDFGSTTERVLHGAVGALQLTTTAVGTTTALGIGGTSARVAAAESKAALPKCFAAGTDIQTPEGDKDIENINAGDTVFAYDFGSGKVVEKLVLEAVSNFTYFWVDVEIAGDVLHATRRHKFWVESEKEWVDASALRPGMVVKLSSGQTNRVARISVRTLSVPEITYNLIVEDAHNYFVGGHHVLVHNGYPELPQYPPATKVGETFQFNFDTSKKLNNSRRAGVRGAQAAGLIGRNDIGHHINSVQSHPHLAAEPSNIAPEASRASHLRTHGGNTQIPMSGPLNAACP